jgi:hypothetical protein
MCDRCEELEARVDKLEAIIQHFEVRGDDDPDLTDLWFNGEPMGHVIENASNRSKEAKQELQNVNTADDGATTPEDLSNLLEVHKDFIDLRDGRREAFKNNGASKQVAAVMFHLFARYEIEDTPGHTGVRLNAPRLTMTSSRAKSALKQAERDYSISLLPASGTSVAIKRGMLMAVRGSHHGDCDGPEQCTDGLFEYRKNDQHTLTVDRAKFRAYLQAWQENRDAGSRAAEANSVVSRDDGRLLPPAQTDGGEVYTD